MFALQSLDTGQVVTIVVSVEGLVLLLNPLFGFISIPEQERTQLWLNVVKRICALVETSGCVICASMHKKLDSCKKHYYSAAH